MKIMSTTELIQTAIPLPAQTDENSSSNCKVTAVKRPSRVESEQDREAFFRALQSFHESRNTPITRIPKVNGKEVDLYLLYNEVISRGGWLKVNIRNEWDELVGSVGFQQRCVNAAVAIKNIYSRFLDKYERLHFLGEDPDKNDDLDDDGRPKKWSSKTYNSIPMTYNYKQHELTEEQRIANRMSTDLYTPSEYDRLLLSLISPLPNEQDFAINVCTLMSNESKHTLKLDHCPKLLDALLAHAGVFCHYTMRDLFQELYTKVRRHSLQSFWKDLLYEKPEILEISYDDYYETPDAKYGGSSPTRTPVHVNRRPNPEDGSNSKADDIDMNNLSFLSLGRGLGTQEYIGQRVHQITSILRNLSFYEENVPVLAKNRTFIRFLVMEANIRWGNLHHMALDVFGNIATELLLHDPTVDDLTRCLMSTVCEGIESMDRGVIISCLEILYKICQQDSNEDHIHRCLNQRLYNTLCLYLSLNDIMLLLYTLEAIYALSSLGHKACNSLVQVRGVINSLMSLITVEAQSYGPDGCILMRVVETVPGNMLPMVAQNIANIANLQNAIHTQQPPHLDPSQAIQSGQTSSRTAQDASQHGTKSPNPSQQEHEQFALSWLSATFELTATPDSRVEQQELYRMYLSATQKCGRRGIVSHMQFPRMVRTIFGANVGPTSVKKADGTIDNKTYYVCIRVRANPLPIQMKVSSPQKGLKEGKQKAELGSVKKTKKKLKLQEQIKSEPQSKLATVSTSNGPSNQTQLPVKAEEPVNQQSMAAQPQQLQVAQPTLPTAIVKCEAPGVSNPKGSLSAQVSKITNTSQPQMIGSVLVTHTPQAPQTPVLKQPVNSVKGTTVTEQSPSVVQQQVQNPTVNSSAQHQQLIATPQQIVNSTPSTSGNGGNGGAQPSSSLIKSLLANKVTSSSTATALTTTNTSATANANTSAAVVIDTNASAPPNTPQSCLITQNVNLHQVAQRQQKQKELAAQQQLQQNTPIKLSSTSISALVNNPLIQTTPMKVGQTTIKPISSSISSQEKKTIVISSENSDNSNWDPIPPLAPLSSGTLMRSNVILQQQVLSANDDSSSASVASSIISSSQIEGDGSFASFEGLLMSKTNKSVSTFVIEDDSSKDSLSRGSKDSGRQVIIANQMLVDLLDKKSPDPPITGKRKHDDDSDESDGKKILLEVQPKVTASKNAANLYAEMAASILEDEDLEEEPPATIIQQTKLAVQTAPIQQEAQSQMISVPVNMQRQLIVNPNNPHQVILSQGTPQANIPTATATIKTDQGLQTLPVILQKNAMGQQILQPVIQQQQPPPQQTQYVLATNPQGQTYLVAQQTQPQQQPQRLLVTQTPQQQVAGTKTIIILQQQGGPPQAVAQPQMITTSQPQKVIMTTPQGQQMIVTQMPRPVQHQIYMNTAGSNVIQTGPIQSHIQMPSQQQIIQKQIQSQQQSSNLLSQLSHIPATIKIHQSPGTIITASTAQLTTTTATTTSLPRLGKSVSIVQQQGVPPPQAQITPTVMQAQIVQHTGTPGCSEKRQVFITGGRAIELTEPSGQGQIVRMVQPTQQKQQKQTLPVQKPVIRQTQISASPQQVQTSTINSNSVQISTQATAPILNQVPVCPPVQASIKTPTPPPQPSTAAPLAVSSTPAQMVTKSGFKTKQEIKPEIKPEVKPEIKVEPKAEKTEEEPPVDLNWIFVCDWRNCPRKKFKSIADLHHHSCLVHCPDHLEAGAEIFCQWGPGPGLCDGIPRKRFSLMTHILDRHLTIESLKAAVQRRLSGPMPPCNGQPVTIIKNAAAVAAQQQAAESARGTASPALSTSSNGSMPSTGSAAMHAIKRHSSDFVNPKELMDENEGPVTKSIRLTAALILRNLVTYTPAAKRILRQYEPHLASVALSNVESSGTISQILFELNN